MIKIRLSNYIRNVIKINFFNGKAYAYNVMLSITKLYNISNTCVVCVF